MIEARELQKLFGNFVAVDGVSFQVKEGEVLGFLGPNGAGKSTTMRMLTGYLPITGGAAFIDGHSVAEEPIVAKRSLGYLPENAPAYPEMTVLEFLRFCGELRGMGKMEREKAVEEAMRTCMLAEVRHQSIDTLSKGYHHRVCFAQAILHHPNNLILDEPTDGLDPNQKNEMRRIIREMGCSKAIIVSTHILEEVEAICTRVALIAHGKLVFLGTPRELRAQGGGKGSIRLRTEVPLERLQAAVSEEHLAISAQAGDEPGVVLLTPAVEKAFSPGDCQAFLKRHDWGFEELSVVEARLDEVFREMTK